MLLPVALVLTLLAAPPATAPDDLASLRAEVAALNQIQATLDWYGATVGEPSIHALTYRGHEHLFSAQSIARVTRELRRKDLSPDERRALEFLKADLALEAVSLATAHFDDEAANAELAATVSLPGEAAPVPYKQLEVLLQNEKDAGRRDAIAKARAQVWRGALNPILEREETARQRVSRELGFHSYVELATQAKRVNLKQLLDEGHAFLLRTDALFQPLLAEVAQRELGLSPRQMHRSDLLRLRNAPRFNRFFPKELMEPAFVAFLGDLGLSLTTVAKTPIKIDSGNNPLKEPRAACFPVHTPDDIRVNVKPTAGLEDYATFFHEGGHALHFANVTTPIFELQALGPNALTEAYAEVFGKSFGDPVYLRHYRDFVKAYNASHHTSVPLLSDVDIREVSRARVYNDFYYLRRYGSAKLIYESVLHGAPATVWKDSYAKPTTDVKAVYQDTFAEAYGVPMSEDDALQFRTDVDAAFYAADYARAFILADTILEAFRARYGGASGDWYGNKEAGRTLLSLYASGQKMEPDEVARLFGKDRLTYEASEARAKRLLGAPASFRP